MKQAKKKTPAKRKYVKRAASWNINKDALSQTIEELSPTIPKKELDELEFLDAVVIGMEQMTPEQKARFMNYIYSRYWAFITLSKLTQ